MTEFAVAAGDARTADAAAEILGAGGSAVDAAIAAALTACAAEPVLASLMGGGFLMVREAEGRTNLLDFFVQTPKAKRPEGELDFREVEADFGETRQVFHIGAGAIAAPGVAAGLFEAHRAYGRMPFAALAEPAISLAKRPDPLPDFQARTLEIVAPIFTATPEARTLYGVEDRVKKAGEALANPELADLIEVYAHEGARFMQEGEPAAALLSLDGGHLQGADLKAYEPIWRRPAEITRGPVRIALNPPPSLGGALIGLALSLIEPGAGPATWARAFAAVSRARMETGLNADPEGGARRIADAALIDRYRRELAGRRAATRGTTHISVIDGDGMGAALTLSNGAGAGLIAPGTGTMPNNMLGEEDLAPGDLMDWTPDRRLSSMMAPMCVLWPDGGAAMLGSGGSNRIRTALAQTLLRVLDGGARLEEAIAAPRLHIETEELNAEAFGEEDRAALTADWPEARFWAEQSMFFGGVHAVRRDAKSAVEAAGDPRRAGAARVGRYSRAR